MTEQAGGAGAAWMPRSPDPTQAATAAVAAATEMSRRELAAATERHDKDMAALRELLSARLAGMDQDRARLWERTHELAAEADATLTRFRGEVERRDQAGRQLIEQRLEDLDKARQIAARQLDQMAAQCAARAAGEREYIMSRIDGAHAETRRVGDVSLEKFAAVDALFASNALALAAALAAQEKAVAAQNDSNTLAISKSESSTKETIAANAAQAQTGLSSLSDQVTDLKDRVVRIESTGAGVISSRSEQRLNISQVIAAVAVIAAIISVVLYAIKK